MANIKVAINPPEVKSVSFNNTFKQAGKPIQLQVKTSIGVKLNPASPTTAVVITKVDVADEEETLTFSVEMLTGANVSTFVDNLDEFLKKNYMSIIMTGVNEKIRAISSNMGINFKLPIIQHEFNGSTSGDATGYTS